MDYISGCFLNIYKHTHRRQKQLVSNSNFFCDDVVITVDDYSIYIKKLTIDYVGKSYKPSLSNKAYHMAIVDVDDILECGKYEFDKEDSTEDCLVVNYRN